MTGIPKRHDGPRELETLLRTHRPRLRSEVRAAFLASIECERPALRGRVPRLAFAAALTVLMLVALAGTGTLTYAAAAPSHAVTALKRLVTKPQRPHVVQRSIALNEYGGGTCGTPKKPCRIAIKDAKVREGNAGTTPMVFTVTLSASPSATVTVHYSTFNNTATAPADYVSSAGTVTFAPGEKSKFIVVSVVGDTIPEKNETFFVDLFNPSPNATIADGHAIGTIVDDDR